MELKCIVLHFCIFLSTVLDVVCVERTTKISTTKEFKYQYLDEYGIPAQGSTAITFQVKACNDAHLAIRTPEIDPIEIVLGTWNNSVSCIRMMISGKCFYVYESRVLNCNEYRSFTVDWKGREERQITVSLGNTASENDKTILSLPLKIRLFNVSLGITTGFGSSGQWLFRVSDDDCAHRTTQISTTKELKYQYLDEYGIPAQGSTAITFQVKACNDAHLVVRTPEIGPMQIILGGWDNTRSCLRRIIQIQGECLSLNIGEILNCDEYRTFTLDWKERERRQLTVYLGNSTVKNSKIILTLPLMFRLFNVSLGISTGYGSSGKWLFQDSCRSVKTTTDTASYKGELTTKSLTIIITVASLTAWIVGAAVGIILGLRYKRNRGSQTSTMNRQYIVSSETVGQSDHPYATIT